jgi:hypothetical protein
MRRTITGGTCLMTIGLLSVLSCSSGPPAATEPAAPASRTAPAPAWTAAGSNPAPPSGSQDTRAQAESACESTQLTHDTLVGAQVAAGFAASGLPASAALLRHFLSGAGTPVNYAPDSEVARLARESPEFTALNKQVTATVARELRAGSTRVTLSATQLPPVDFSTTALGDLYWGFRGTQGLTVTGHGRSESGRYTGTVTYVIRDSYGFPAGDTLDGFGPPMRYLQTDCGAPGQPGGAHWFPDTITVTVPFSQ